MTGKRRTVRRQLFPEKLWDLVNKPASGIQWSPDGKRIEVERTQLEKFIGTKFRSHNFDSFIRQLHFYGFRKCGNSYHHDKFQRGQPDALLTMKRKYSNLALTSLCHTNSHSPCYTSNTSNSNDSTSSISASANTGIVNGVIDLSGVGNSNNNNSNDTSDHTPNNNNNSNQLENNNCAIDYSYNRQKIAQSPNKSHSKSLSSSGSTKSQPKDCSKEIIMYTLKPTEPKPIQASTGVGTISSFTNIREDVAKADSANNSIKITIPDIIKDTGNNEWPKTLVLDNYWNGSQNILSAYFIYRTN